MSGPDKVVVIALGNRFRGDDGIGPVVAGKLKQRGSGGHDGGALDCAVIEGRDDAMALVSAWEDTALAVVIDAAVSGAAPGTVHRLEAGAEALPNDLARCSSHGLGLAEAVALGRALGRLPRQLVILAVEAAAFGRGAAMSPQVTAAADEVVRRVEAELAAYANRQNTTPPDCTAGDSTVMHEASLMRSLMHRIVALAEAEGASRVTTVRVWLGALSHMSADHFQEHFDQASRSTVAAGAALEIEQSDDLDDPNAQGLLLRSIEVET